MARLLLEGTVIWVGFNQEKRTHSPSAWIHVGPLDPSVRVGWENPASLQGRKVFLPPFGEIVRPPRSEGFLFKGVAKILTKGGKKTPCCREPLFVAGVKVVTTFVKTTAATGQATFQLKL